MTLDPKGMESWLAADDDELPPALLKKQRLPQDSESLFEGSLDDKYPSLMPILEATGADLEDAIGDISLELLKDQDADYDDFPADVAAIRGICRSLGSDLVEAIETELCPLMYDDAIEIGQALEDGECVVDGGRLGGFLFHACRLFEEGDLEDPDSEEY